MRLMQMLQEEEEKKEWTGIWSVVYLTHAQIHIVAAARKVSAYQSNKTICFTLLSTIATLMYIYTYIYIEKVRDASFVMVKTDNSINHIFTCNTKKNFSKSFSFYLFSFYLQLFGKEVKNRSRCYL
jgi:hypothetical protein